ncbi:MAG: cytoplasmic protein [Verrucomicrobiaceae bacterium]|nr:cytoplasmic protein [Verrucomicrobiaceae bacterium]
MNTAPDMIVAAHKASSGHRSQLLSDGVVCGCFHCCEIFAPSTITEWIDEDDSGLGQTAMCPRCGIDSVIGSGSGYPITTDFLTHMRDHWFGVD